MLTCLGRSRFPLWLFALLGVVLAGGCDSRPAAYPVQGKVKFKGGAPVRMGSLEFRSRESKTIARGSIEKDGSFTLTTYEPGDGAVAGTHDCVIVQFVMTEGLQDFKGSSYGVIHPRYRSYHTSQLSCSVQESPTNPITLEVDPTPPRRGVSREHKHDHGTHTTLRGT